MSALPIITISGPTGSGKSTLAMLVAGALANFGIEAEIHGEEEDPTHLDDTFPLRISRLQKRGAVAVLKMEQTMRDDPERARRLAELGIVICNPNALIKGMFVP